jgi:hypothetical protein
MLILFFCLLSLSLLYEYLLNYSFFFLFLSALKFLKFGTNYVPKIIGQQPRDHPIIWPNHMQIVLVSTIHKPLSEGRIHSGIVVDCLQCWPTIPWTVSLAPPPSVPPYASSLLAFGWVPLHPSLPLLPINSTTAAVAALFRLQKQHWTLASACTPGTAVSVLFRFVGTLSNPSPSLPSLDFLLRNGW